MADPKFFKNKGPFTASALAKIANAELRGTPDKEYQDVAAIDQATSNQVSFLDNRKYIEAFKSSKAGLCIVHPDLAELAPNGMDLLITDQPYMAYALISRAYYLEILNVTNISSRAHIDEDSIVGEGCCIEAGAFIAKGVKIGKNCWIKANAVIRENVEIGDDCIIGSNTTITHAVIGNAVQIDQGTQIGQEGFGFASGPQGHVRIPQLGRVIIQDHVHIGANSTIDRGAGPDTVIGAGTQIDNLVQIGHNVQTGMGCVIVSHVGISGSTKIGNFVVVGGQTGMAGHLEIGDGARVAARSGVTKNLEGGKTYAGFPAIPHSEWLRQQAKISMLTKRKK